MQPTFVETTIVEEVMKSDHFYRARPNKIGIIGGLSREVKVVNSLVAQILTQHKAFNGKLQKIFQILVNRPRFTRNL